MKREISRATTTRPKRLRALVIVAAALVPILAVTLVAGHLLALPAKASGSLSFAAAVNYPDPIPSAAAVGDLNGDGKPDIALANQNGTVDVLLNDGTGAFSTPTSLPIGGSTLAVAIVDVNKDGIPDLITTNSRTSVGGAVTVLLGQGGGYFGNATIYGGAGLNPVAMAIGDLNGDGRPDVAFVDGANELGVMLQNGGGFPPATFYSISSGSGPAGVAIGDLNGDGVADVVTANRGSGTVSVLFGLGGGTGNLATPVNFSDSSAGPPFAVAIGDLNGDNIPDLVTANTDGTPYFNGIAVLLGLGSGRFAPATTYPADRAPESVAISDINRDGHPDLVAANNGFTQDVSVLLGDGTGAFAAAQNFAVDLGPVSVVAADLNSDGKPDIVTANNGTGDVSVLLNTTASGTPTPTPTVSPTPGSGGSGTTQVTVALAPGELSATTTTAPSLSATLNGQDQTLNYSLPITVTDGTATGNGWNLTITSTQFSTLGAAPTTLPTTASTTVSVASVCAANNCTNPTNTVSYPFTIPAGTTAPTPVKLFNAAAGTGMGVFTVTPSVNILIPATTIAGTYSSTITLAIVSGP